MKKNKLKYIIFILVLFIANIPYYTFAETTNNNTNTTPNTILEGEIGEWDPNMDDAPDFSEITDIEGSIPNEGEYVTISVTVPIAMEFYVLPHSNLAFGSFYSPEYTIKNNGTKTVVAKINSFSMENSEESDTNTPLYIEKVVGGDGKTQMELGMCEVKSLDSTGKLKRVDLTQIDNLRDENRILCELQTNEMKKVKFVSDNWELPQFESNKDTASSSYIVGFEFSIKN
ncbi:MAG: hypothetical protein HUJ77_02045 [Clostridium sp.]|uniref:hypothetical protein n=1 Tax=Clostridium sp. TaxID=1506 RepID=UPI0025B972E2|nr:hypothetical protein [Clostridium sp.]MCF0147159.1 hypothetical protein [Clostridium sp.]